MKYIIDLDKFKECLDFLSKPVNFEGHQLVRLEDVKNFVDAFPKDEVDNDNSRPTSP